MKKPHINTTSTAKSGKSNSLTATQPVAERDRVSHGLRILGQLTVQDANRAASMIGLQNHEQEEPFPSAYGQGVANSRRSAKSVNQASRFDTSSINQQLATDNLRTINSIDSLLSYRSEQVVLPASNFLQSMTFDCSIQPSTFKDLSEVETSLENSIDERSNSIDSEKMLSDHAAIENIEATSTKNDDLKYHPEVRRAVDHLAKQLTKGKSRVWQFHALTAPAHEEAVTQLWPLALCWANVRSESLLVIDATQHGHSLASAWGWQDDVGLQDILFDEKLPSAALRKTHFDKLTFLSRGITRADDFADWSSGAEHQLRLKSLLMALQRDYAAIWVVTSGTWNSFCHAISESAHKRELVIPMSASNTAQVWRTSVNQLIQQNVLINGWLALGNSETKQLSA